MNNMAELYKKHLLEIIDEMTDETKLKRIYRLAEYLHIHKKDKEAGAK